MCVLEGFALVKFAQRLLVLGGVWYTGEYSDPPDNEVFDITFWLLSTTSCCSVLLFVSLGMSPRLGVW